MKKLMKVTGEYDVSKIINKMEEINQLNSFVYSYGDILQYKFYIDKKVNTDAINSLIEFFNKKIPKDFIDFFSICNGVRLEADSNISGAEEILESLDAIDFPKNILCFGSCYCGDTYFLIDTDKYQSECVYITEPIGHEYAYSLNCTFVDFLNMYACSYGAAFWDLNIDYNNRISIMTFEDSCSYNLTPVSTRKQGDGC